MHDDTFQYVEKLNPEMKRYLQCMTDIKIRWSNIRSRLQSSGFKKTKINAESICLQFRMITELVFLANYSSHEVYYKKLLFELVAMWKIREIIAEIENVNPNYYPQVIRLDKKPVPGRPDADGSVIFIKHGALPKEEILKIYNKCSDFLHPLNPFSKREKL